MAQVCYLIKHKKTSTKYEPDYIYKVNTSCVRQLAQRTLVEWDLNFPLPLSEALHDI